MENKQNLISKAMPRVLVICTGGTFAAVRTPMGYKAAPNVVERVKVFKSLYDEEFSRAYGCKENECITPVTPFEKRILWTMLEFEVFLDSSNMDLADQIKIARKIEEHYHDFDAFIVVHGTDTMAYTASTLSFILENLNKSVILTGSQIPILELKNDAVDNFLASLLFACQYSIPEVMICFGNKLVRGNRARKTSSNQLVAFTSPNFGLLGEVGVNFLVHWERILGHSYFGEFSV